jgi:hypothetical protein
MSDASVAHCGRVPQVAREPFEMLRAELVIRGCSMHRRKRAEEAMALNGKLEVTIKINQLPAEVATTKNGWKEFHVDFGPRSAVIALRPRLWTRLETASRTFPHWIAVITGQMGEDVTKGCFRLLEPNVQVFEYTPKVATPQPAPAEQGAPAPEETKES